MRFSHFSKSLGGLVENASPEEENRALMKLLNSWTAQLADGKREREVAGASFGGLRRSKQLIFMTYRLFLGLYRPEIGCHRLT